MITKLYLWLTLLFLTFGFVGCDFVPGGSAPAATETQFTVAAGQKYTVAVQLREGRSVEGSFSISGQENYIDFYVKAPNGMLAYGVVRAVNAQSFEAEADQDGAYALTFDNSISFGSPRQISLRYQVR